MNAISRASAKRFRIVISGLTARLPEGRQINRIALADRSHPTVVQGLSLDSGKLLDCVEGFDVIMLDSDAARRLPAESLDVLISRLEPGGLIAIRGRASLFRFPRSFRLRRVDDTGTNPFLRGLPRSEATFQQARLHVARLRVRVSRLTSEEWVIGSRDPLRDDRFRDQIGRVATDYLRLVGPIVAGIHLPGS